MAGVLSEAVAVLANMLESALGSVASVVSATVKITGSHLERVAIVYLRQSSPRSAPPAGATKLRARDVELRRELNNEVAHRVTRRRPRGGAVLI